MDVNYATFNFLQILGILRVAISPRLQPSYVLEYVLFQIVTFNKVLNRVILSSFSNSDMCNLYEMN